MSNVSDEMTNLVSTHTSKIQTIAICLGVGGLHG